MQIDSSASQAPSTMQSKLQKLGSEREQPISQEEKMKKLGE